MQLIWQRVSRFLTANQHN